ncbi:hypothetical protein CHLNCDRAFT_53651 [Chlorella variabilis]|uniref:TFIIS central domain-containing protein n=1 Tax=Chlorella variabilis TaxID=554065 RepID=E1ZKK7_CHLVA|nr:hypothetical protein CHLNCDRAFT_53651 [Chlorella variabilis]EFN53710.1 hypothetical protein CHLNCDRAFT_53651 [Chlorella variabilis]|eukprot:XP_005845812.1 hypothetical protein CHLNCDRAFT_53651 [Chlorella variabilis]
MSESRRLAKAASTGADVGSRRQNKMKQVYRLLRQGDIGESLASKTVYVLWPDDGTWYKGRVTSCDIENAKATIYYDETEETEECDLKELIRDGQIAFKEPRPVGHKCKSGEIGLDQRYYGRKPGDAALEDSDSGSKGGEGEGSEEEADAGAVQDSDSDVSFSSGELAGRKRKRGAEDSDDEVHLEDFEKREIMRDMSDDEKPLGFRADELERKQKRQQAQQKRQQAPGSGSAKSAAPALAGGAAAAPKKAAAEQPVPRRRREAAAGVAAAVQAVAAVQAAAAADASSDEEPASARKHRQRQQAVAGAMDEDDEEAEAEAFARNLLARVTGNAAGHREAGSTAFYGRQGSGGRELGRRMSTGQNEEELRQKVRGGIQQALELVATEAAGEAGRLPEPAPTAEAVEAALFKLYGGTTKDYKQKFRTLQFNLKDAHNPDLRAHVLRGDIAPDAFVRMTATELANKELAAYRKAKEEEALKMSVLDAEAAAKFSTAAALDARDKLAIPASMMADNGMLAAREPTPEPAAHSKRSPSPGAGAASAAAADSAPAASPRGAQQSTLLGAGASGPLGKVDGGEGSEYRVSDSMDAELAPAGGDEEYDPETAFAEDDAKPAAAAAPALDWAAIKAAAASATAEERQSGMQLLGSLDSLHAGSKQEGAEGKHEHKLKHHHHRREHASPLELPSPRELGDQPLPSPVDPGSPHSLRYLLLPAVDPSCLFGKGVWEGQFFVPGVGAFLLTADALAGSGDVAALLGDREIEVKGRLALQKLDNFLTDLRHSRSRTVTLGLLSPADDCQPEERSALQELIGQYSARGRTGVATPSRDVEAYLLPACGIADRLLTATHSAGGSQVEALLPGGSNQIGPHQLLLVIIHRRDWRPPYDFVRPVKRPRVHPPPGAAAAEPAPGAGEAAPGVSAPVLPPPPVLPGMQPQQQQQQQDGAAAAPAPPVALPEGLDFGAISALAAALGVGPAAPEQQQPLSGPMDRAPPQAAPSLQMDQLQQLLASLPPAAVVPGAAAGVPDAGAQHAEGRQRRSRWEGSEEQQQQGQGLPQRLPQQEQDAQLQQAKKRRSRWEGSEEEGGKEPPEQLASSVAPPPASTAPAPGPMGPMQRAGALQQPGMSQPPPPQQQQQQYVLPHGMQPYQPQLNAPEGQQQQYGMPPQPQFDMRGPQFQQQQAGMMPPRHTGGFSASSGPPQQSLPMASQYPAAGGPQQPPQEGFPPPAGPPMYHPQQQFGGGPPQQQYGEGGFGGRGGRMGGRFGGGGKGRWGGRDGGRGRGGRGGRPRYE